MELETEADYSMPERVMVYDACEWERQIRETAGRRWQEGGKITYRDKKSRLGREDFLLPVVTVVVYLGSGRWQGKRKMSELYHIPKEWRALLEEKLPDYSFILMEADAVQWLEQVVVRLYLESVENEFLQHRYKDQQAVVSPPAQQLGRLHAVRLFHLDVQKNHIKAISRIQQGAAIGKTAEVVSGD